MDTALALSALVLILVQAAGLLALLTHASSLRIEIEDLRERLSRAQGRRCWQDECPMRRSNPGGVA